MAFANFGANLLLNISNFAAGMRNASTLANRFAANMSGRINNGVILPTKKAGVEFKDVARIVQGIIISKIFYGSLNAIRHATAAVWEFTQELEYAKIAYANLFGDVSLATEFIHVLEDFAAKTPFTFQESEAAAKRLLAYGIQYKNVMYMMRGILAASSMQGNPQVIEAVSRAMGQIYTKGRLMNEEMRQLAEAGIPAYDILREKLGLTQEQLQNLGRQSIPAATAINALIDGITERFGGVIDASSLTLKGIISNIKDNATMLLSSVFEPISYRLKTTLHSLGEWLFKLREIQSLKGLGGVFEYLVPKDLQGTIRVFVANLINIGASLKVIFKDIGIILKTLGAGAIKALNVILPVIASIVGIFSELATKVLQNERALQWLTAGLIAASAAWLIFKTRALSMLVLKAVGGVIIGLARALGFLATTLMTHPIVTILALGTAALLAFSIASKSADNAVSNFFKKVTSFSGIDPNKLLLPSQKERANDLEKFNERLDESATNMGDLADEATRASKSLLSFDEVFRLTEPDEGTDSGIDPNDFFDGFDWDSTDFIPEIPSFTEFATNFISQMSDDLKTALKNAAIGALIGAGLGAIIGGILFGPAGAALGAKIGLFAGAVVGLFWIQIQTAFGLTDTASVTIPIGAAIGAVIGLVLAGRSGAIIGAAIGALATGLADLLWTKLAEKLNKGPDDVQEANIGSTIGFGLGAIIGGILGGPAGAVIGAAVGLLIGGLVGMFKDEIWAFITDPSTISTALGGSIGAAIGFAIAGPPGAIIGMAVGALAAWICTEFGGSIKSVIEDPATVTVLMAGAIGAAIGLIIAGPAGAAIGLAIGALVAWIDEQLSSGLDGEIRTTEGLGTIIGMAIAFVIGGLVAGPMGAVIGAAIVGVAAWISDEFATALDDIFTSPSGLGTFIGGALGAAIGGIIGGPAGALIGMAIGGVVGWIIGLITENFKKGESAWNDTLIGKEWQAINTSRPGYKPKYAQHATGGLFTKEHIASFAEGNKAELAVPLENNARMQPFVDAISNGIVASMAPMLAGASGGESRQPIYVGTLIADDRGLKELYRKMEVIKVSEKGRKV